MRRWLPLLLILAAAAVVTPWYLRNRWSSQGELVRGPTYEGIILDMAHVEGEGAPKSWPMDTQSVQLLEQRLPLFLHAGTNDVAGIAGNLGDYYRQYSPVMRGRKHLIAVEFFHHDLITRYQWLHRTPVLPGGGRLHCRALYETERGIFLSFQPVEEAGAPTP